MKIAILSVILVLLGFVGFLILHDFNQLPIEKLPKKSTMKLGMQITSNAFKNNESIPSKYSCDGTGIHPQLSFLDAPLLTRSMVLIVDDPDAPSGTFVHWVVYNIPSSTKEIEEGKEVIGATNGKNSAGREGYFAPCPPNGAHRYFFKLYALDSVLPLPPGMSKEDIINSIKGHVLEESDLVGIYKR
ncbi:MAG TPA: YbhB/YbcL family Raf kinase inhibitor-like protein [Patescibacteria group bacterium]